MVHRTCCIDDETSSPTESVHKSEPWPGGPMCPLCPLCPLRAPGDPALPPALSAQEDIGLLRELHVNHYRFSLSWPRLLPTGIRGELGQPPSPAQVWPLLATLALQGHHRVLEQEATGTLFLAAALACSVGSWAPGAPKPPL